MGLMRCNVKVMEDGLLERNPIMSVWEIRVIHISILVLKTGLYKCGD